MKDKIQYNFCIGEIGESVNISITADYEAGYLAGILTKNKVAFSYSAYVPQPTDYSKLTKATLIEKGKDIYEQIQELELERGKIAAEMSKRQHEYPDYPDEIARASAIRADVLSSRKKK